MFGEEYVSQLPVTIEDIRAAQSRIEGHAIKTPLMEHPLLNEKCGGRVFLKLENLQRTGSFKFRGAMSALSNMTDDVRNKGIVASSSGNHAQAVAAASAYLGCPATMIMPSDAPAIKQQRTKSFGAEVILYDRLTDDRDAIAKEICERLNAQLVHPFENVDVIAGQGTIGLEVAERMSELGVSPDIFVVCTGGGGLTSGVSTALRHSYPEIEIYAVEPEDFDDFGRSLELGERVANEKTTGSKCDAVLTPAPGVAAFEIMSNLSANGVTVSDADAMAAVAFAFRELKLVVEPGGAVALAALLSGKIKLEGKTAVATLSGGNVDPEILQEALAA